VPMTRLAGELLTHFSSQSKYLDQPQSLYLRMEEAAQSGMISSARAGLEITGTSGHASRISIGGYPVWTTKGTPRCCSGRQIAVPLPSPHADRSPLPTARDAQL
jgi:hypothetical protein